MGYFSNGTEGMDYQSRYCEKCYHDRNGSCVVWLAHLVHNYDECNKPDSILNLLIPRSKDDLDNERCTMFVPDSAVTPDVPEPEEVDMQKCRKCGRQSAINVVGVLVCAACKHQEPTPIGAAALAAGE